LPQIHVVDETREYAEWSDDCSVGVNGNSGIIAAKRALNKLHFELGLEGFSQVSLSYSCCICMYEKVKTHAHVFAHLNGSVNFYTAKSTLYCIVLYCIVFIQRSKHP
jgi:hypothetical protein